MFKWVVNYRYATTVEMGTLWTKFYANISLTGGNIDSGLQESAIEMKI